jgi:hypothetical protein
MSPRAAAWLAWACCGLSLGLIACATLLDALSRTLTLALLSLFGDHVSTGLCALVGAVVASRRPRNPVGWILIAIAASFALERFTSEYASYTVEAGPAAFPLVGLADWLANWIWFPGLVLLLCFLPLYFPDGHLISPHWRWVVRFALVFVVVMVVPSGFVPDEAPAVVTGTMGTGIFFASTLSLVIRFRQSRGAERQQIKWLTYAVSALAAWTAAKALLFSFLIDTVIPPALFEAIRDPIDGLLSAGVPLAVGIAVLRYRLYDIDVIINRTLVYGSLTATLVLVYFGGIVVLQRLFVVLTGQESTLAVVASTLVIAALFQPLRGRIQGFIDRRFYRRRYDARKTLESFSATLRDETDLEALNKDLVGVVRETMQPAYVSLWLRSPTEVGRVGESSG